MGLLTSLTMWAWPEEGGRPHIAATRPIWAPRGGMEYRRAPALMAACLALLCLTWVPIASAAAPVGSITYTRGKAWVWHGKQKLAAKLGLQVVPGDVVVTQERARVKLRMADNSNVYIANKSRIVIKEYKVKKGRTEKGSFDLLWGKSRFLVNKLYKRGRLDVRTKTAVLGVRGTEFNVLYQPPAVPPSGPSVAFEQVPVRATRGIITSGVVLGQTVTGQVVSLTAGTTNDFQPDGTVVTAPTKREDVDHYPETKEKAKKEKKEGEKGKAEKKAEKKGKAKAKEEKKEGEKGKAEKKGEPKEKATAEKKAEKKGKTEEKTGAGEKTKAEGKGAATQQGTAEPEPKAGGEPAPGEGAAGNPPAESASPIEGSAGSPPAEGGLPAVPPTGSALQSAEAPEGSGETPIVDLALPPAPAPDTTQQPVQGAVTVPGSSAGTVGSSGTAVTNEVIRNVIQNTTTPVTIQPKFVVP